MRLPAGRATGPGAQLRCARWLLREADPRRTEVVAVEHVPQRKLRAGHAGRAAGRRACQNRVLNPTRAIDCSAPLDAPFASITPLICALLPWFAR